MSYIVTELGVSVKLYSKGTFSASLLLNSGQDLVVLKNSCTVEVRAQSSSQNWCQNLGLPTWKVALTGISVSLHINDQILLSNLGLPCEWNLVFLCLCVCVCVCSLRLCTCVGGYSHLCMYVWRPEVGFFLYVSPPYFFEQGVILNLEFPVSSTLVATRYLELACIVFENFSQMLGPQVHSATFNASHEWWRFKSKLTTLCCKWMKKKKK